MELIVKLINLFESAINTITAYYFTTIIYISSSIIIGEYLVFSVFFDYNTSKISFFSTKLV